MVNETVKMKAQVATATGMRKLHMRGSAFSERLENAPQCFIS